MKNIILLGITSLLTDVSSEMIYPLLGLYLASLNTPFSIIGIIEGIAESVANLLKIFSGSFSDKFKKRKPFAIFGYSFSTIGKMFLYVSKTWFMVLLARVVDRLGKGVRTAPRDALISESIDDVKKGKVFGLHRAMDTFGAMLGVIVVYIVFYFYPEEVPFKKVFLLSLIPAFLAVVVLFFVKEPKKKEFSSKRAGHKLFSFRYIPEVAKKYIFISAIFSLGNSSNQFLLLRAKHLGVSYLNIILLYLIYNISYTIFSYPAGILGDKIGKKTTIILGYLIYSFVYFGFFAIKKPDLIWILFVVYGIYIAIVEGQEKAFLAEISPPEYKATVLGTHSTVGGFMLFFASTIAGFLWDSIGVGAPFLFGSFTGLIALFLMIILL